MTLKARCCCGTEEPCAQSCDWASSYSVSGIAGSYSFQRQSGPGQCGFTCFSRSFEINVNWSQLGPIVVARQSSPGGVAPCCYHGEGVLAVSGTLTITEDYWGGPSGCGTVSETYTYAFSRDVPCAVTISCGGQNGCGFSTANPPGWTHTLHICDFLVACSHEGIHGDCEQCPETQYPVALRCVGGTVSYVSDLVAPDSITQSGCLGWYVRGQCGSSPFPAMLSNVALGGPFSIHADGECSEQDEYESCTLGVLSDVNYLKTLVESNPLTTPWLADPADTTKSPCGSTDWSGGPNPDCVGDIIQSGCGGSMPWEYS